MVVSLNKYCFKLQETRAYIVSNIHAKFELSTYFRSQVGELISKNYPSESLWIAFFGKRAKNCGRKPRLENLSVKILEKMYHMITKIFELFPFFPWKLHGPLEKYLPATMFFSETQSNAQFSIGFANVKTCLSQNIYV